MPSKSGLLGALVLALAPLLSQAAPLCSNSQSLGPLSPNTTVTVNRPYITVAQFSDCYNFSLNFGADAQGSTVELNPLFGFSALKGTIDVWGVELFKNGVSVGAFDNSPETFAFPGLLDGNYLLNVTGHTTAGSRGVRVSYDLSLTAVPTAGNDEPLNVPEPASLALVALGLGAAGLARRRRRA